MKEPQQQTLQTDEEVTLVVSGEEATLVSPRFDDEETLVARPVVPLDGEAVEASTSNDATPAADVPAHTAYARRPYAPRRPWVLALVLVSVLVGGVLGGAGLYIYQRQSQDDGGVTAGATTQPETPNDAQQQPPPTVPNGGSEAAPPPTAQTQPDTPAGETTDADVQPSEPAADDSEMGSTPVREAETKPAAERRDSNGDDGRADTRKRGKKGEHDDDVERPRRRANRPDSDAPIARDDDTGAREARRVDTIVYRPRRAARRARRDAARDTDRVRRIFEGTPE